MATLRDIATEVGVSIRTVTRALSGTGYVRSDVRERIIAVANRLGYRPDPVAQSLRLGRSRQIVVVSYSVDELHMAKIASLEQRARPMGYSVSVMMARPADLESDALVPEIRSRKPSGVAVIGHLQVDPTPLAAALYAAGIPCVPVDAKSRFPAVLVDRPAGVAEAARYLIGRGRQRVVYAGPADSSSRIDGFSRAMLEHDREPFLYAPGDDHSAEILTAGLLDAYPDVDAVQAYSDEWALELLGGLHRRGVRVPDDVAVVGFDDRWAASHSWPRLTTVAQPGEEIGAAVADLLVGERRRWLDDLLEKDPDATSLVQAKSGEGVLRVPSDRGLPSDRGVPDEGAWSGEPVWIPTRLVIRETT